MKKYALLALIAMIAPVYVGQAQSYGQNQGNVDLISPFLSGAHYQLGWAAGYANYNDPNSTKFVQILSSQISGSDLVVYYNWRQGKMQLTQYGNMLVGTWCQYRSAGRMELSFDNQGNFVQGRWNDNTDGIWYPAYLN